ncbi:MAG: hypothetical protein ACFFGZ_05045 [Candidatus Thorarchaeota archaeon]
MPSLSNKIIVFASFYPIGSGLAIVAVVPPGTRKRGTHKCSTPAQEVWNGNHGPEWNNTFPAYCRRPCEPAILAGVLPGDAYDWCTRVFCDTGNAGLRSEKAMM